MGAIGGILGLGGGAGGTGFKGPESAMIQPTVETAQANAADQATQQALRDQLYSQLAAAKSGTSGFNAQEQALGGLGNLSGQLGQVALGQGPNPAQAMLNQQTGNNIQQQAALMAGQRGVGANAGMLARQAAQQGGNLQQQAVGQGATMQSQQMLGAMGAQAGVLGQLAGQGNAQVANYLNQTNANVAARQAQQANLINAINAQNQAQVSNQASINSANAGLAQKMMGNTAAMIGGAANAGAAGGAAGGAAAAAHGGMINYADGGGVGASPVSQSSFGSFLSRVTVPDMAPSVSAPGYDNSGEDEMRTGLRKALSAKTPKAPPGAVSEGYMPQAEATPGAAYPGQAKGGMVDVVLSPGEKVVAPKDVKKAAGGNVQAKTVPGQAKVSGDSYANDTFKTKLEAGSVVVPRTKAKDRKSSADFVRKTLARRGKK